MKIKDEGAVSFDAISVRNGAIKETTENVAEESPLEIRLAYGNEGPSPFAVIMRTPGMDIYLAAGYLFSEKIINSRSDILGINEGSQDNPEERNSVTVSIKPGLRKDDGVRGVRRVNSSCGLCSKSSVNELFLKSGIIRNDFRINGSVIASLPEKLKTSQRIFSITGGLHGASLFDYQGTMIFSAEDIGRHNAVDKVIGYAFLKGGINMSDTILQVSGRCGFEILQKAAVAGIPFVSAVSAPSSLSVEAARTIGITLACFVRGDRFTVYSHPERILGLVPENKISDH